MEVTLDPAELGGGVVDRLSSRLRDLDDPRLEVLTRGGQQRPVELGAPFHQQWFELPPDSEGDGQPDPFVERLRLRVEPEEPVVHVEHAFRADPVDEGENEIPQRKQEETERDPRQRPAEGRRHPGPAEVAPAGRVSRIGLQQGKAGASRGLAIRALDPGAQDVSAEVAMNRGESSSGRYPDQQEHRADADRDQAQRDRHQDEKDEGRHREEYVHEGERRQFEPAAEAPGHHIAALGRQLLRHCAHPICSEISCLHPRGHGQ